MGAGGFVEFKRELSQDIFEEAMPLLIKHWHEVAFYKDIPLEPDFNLYQEAELAGLLRTYTARGEAGILVGYAVFSVKSNPHYKSSIQATQDILFIHPDHRGTGGRFINWCDDQLRAEGVQVSHHHVKRDHNFGPLLERFGYELVDLIYAKRLDKTEASNG